MLSIICPTYNQGQYLEQGLNSILMQKTDFTYEVLVGEDCSPDNSLELLKNYQSKFDEKEHAAFQIFHREQNLRQSKNVYDLFQRTRGKYVCILDLDDFWTDDQKLQKQVDFLENHPEYIGVACDFDIVNKEGEPVLSKDNQTVKEFLNKDFTLQDFLDKGFVFQTGTFLYHNIWKEKNEKQEDYSILYKADHTVIDLTIYSMLLQMSNIYIMQDKMSAYRVVISTDATNARSIGEKDLAYDMYTLSEQLRILYQYFDKKIDYSTRWSNLIWRYMKGLLAKGDHRYHVGQWLSMFFRSSARSKQRFLSDIGKSISRAAGRLFKHK